MTATTPSSSRAIVRPRRLSVPTSIRGGWSPDALGILGISAALLLLGLVMTFSASFVASTVETQGNAFSIFRKQGFWALVGTPVAVVAALVDYRRWRRWAGVAVLATVAGLAAVLMVGEVVNGARRWFTFGPVSVQPAEIIKLTLPLWCAAAIDARKRAIARGDIGALLGPTLLAAIPAVLLVAAGPDLESAVLVLAIALTCVFVAGLPLRLLVVGGSVAGALATWSILTTPYRVGRFAAWMDPTAFADTYGYQTTQGFMALARGGMFGLGLGEGRGKWLYVPNAHTDFIYAIVGEELGLIGALALLLALATLAVLGIRVAARADDVFGRVLAAGITAWLFLQAAINISSVVGLLPVTGVTLPLVSFGGSSLVITMAGVGLLIAIARHSARTQAESASVTVDLAQARRRRRAP